MRSSILAIPVAAAILLGLAPAAQAAAPTATVAVQAQAQAGASACTYRRVGATWRCITPGAYCPKAAHFKYGYAKVTSRQYKCSQYTSTTWRWKRV